MRDAAVPACPVSTPIGGLLAATTSSIVSPLGTTGLSVPPGAFTRTDELALPSFVGEVSCGDDLVKDAAVASAALAPLGPAITFTAKKPIGMAVSLRREVDVAIPINPAAFPPAARMRHLQVLFKNSLRAKKPRVVTVANPRIEKVGTEYVLRFSTPWFGTYQAAIAKDAGARTHKRRLTHRAVLGFSMGGGGAASFGTRHHDKFDVIAPLGGPSDWTWLLWFIENYALGGFCPADKPGCPKTAPNRYPFQETFAHSMDWNHWWYQDGEGNGGRFPRDEYVQIFQDLALMQGNPNGQNQDPRLSYLAPGFTAKDVSSNPGAATPEPDCGFWVEPIKNDPKQEQQKATRDKCKAMRCDPTRLYKAEKNFFDDEYNPDGTLPVIAFCDGNQKGESPYKNTFAPGGNEPVGIVLAVDRNKNGLRDEDEPVIRSGHEPYDDVGIDGLANEKEPGYDPETNPDPNQDDYDYQINPNGTEANHRYDQGEPFRDFGLDGVPNTASRHVAGDPGEGDGVFTMADGLKNFYSNDMHSIVHRWVDKVPAGLLDDKALGRVDFLVDGGVRDLFNFASVANHASGAVAGRLGPNGLPLRTSVFYNNFNLMPGQNPKDLVNFSPDRLRWADIPDMPNLRYGDVDASAKDIQLGDGMHVGTGLQILYRLQLGFYFVSQRWSDADRRRTEIEPDSSGKLASWATSTVNEQGLECEARAQGKCEKIFRGPVSKREGPIAVGLPPGYGLEQNKHRRYPVLYVLHGYGQDPRDLEALAILTNNFMNKAEQSYATRLAKFIVVYVDGRCRTGVDGKPECIQGTFYLNSNRPEGPQMDTWFEEVMQYIDTNYRTMGPSEVDVAD